MQIYNIKSVNSHNLYILLQRFENMEFWKGNKTLKQLSKFEPGCWVQVHSNHIMHFSKEHNLDSELVHDALDPHEIPRLEVIDKTVYLFTKTITKNGFDTLLIIFGKNFFATVCRNKPLCMKGLEVNTLKRRESITKILSANNDVLENEVIKIVKRVQAQQQLQSHYTEKELETFLTDENFLNILVSNYFYMEILYEKLMRTLRFPASEKEYIESLIVESTQGYNQCKNALKTIRNIREYYSIIISNKLNRTIKILTIFTIMISIPAAVSGFYGMNIKLPIQQHPSAWIIILAGISLLWVTFLWYLSRKKVL